MIAADIENETPAVLNREADVSLFHSKKADSLPFEKVFFLDFWGISCGIFRTFFGTWELPKYQILSNYDYLSTFKGVFNIINARWWGEKTYFEINRKYRVSQL